MKIYISKIETYYQVGDSYKQGITHPINAWHEGKNINEINTHFENLFKCDMVYIYHFSGERELRFVDVKNEDGKMVKKLWSVGLNAQTVCT